MKKKDQVLFLFTSSVVILMMCKTNPNDRRVNDYTESHVIPSRISWINNDSITNYDCFWQMPDLTDRHKPRKIVINLSLTDKQTISLDSITYTQWLGLLQNDNSDWIANLLLYDIFGKNGFLFMVDTTRNLWLTKKVKDLEYWKVFLKTHLDSVSIYISTPRYKIMSQFPATVIE